MSFPVPIRQSLAQPASGSASALALSTGASRFAPIPQGPPSPSFVKPLVGLVGKSRPATSSLLPTSLSAKGPFGFSPPSSPLTSPASQRRHKNRAIAALLVGALAALFILSVVGSLELDLTSQQLNLDQLSQLSQKLRASLLGSVGVHAGDRLDAGRWAPSPAFGKPLLAETEVVQHAPGWTTFSHLYSLDSTFYILSSRPATTFPSLRAITSSGAVIGNSEAEIAAREPTDKDMQVITPAAFADLISATDDNATDNGKEPLFRVEGLSWIVNDPPQFLAHFYHFAAELLYGFVRSSSSLCPAFAISSSGEVGGKAWEGVRPHRMIFTHVENDGWDDYAGINKLLMRAVFPATFILNTKSFENLSTCATGRRRALIYDQVIFADRAAAMRGNRFPQTMRTASEAFDLPSIPYWWAPIRRRMLDYVRDQAQTASSFTAATVGSALPEGRKTKPVVTYVSRQNWNRRKLASSSHESLVAALERAAEDDGWELLVVDMERLTLEMQVTLAGRSDVLMGVHGNGLTHLLWMEPKPTTTVLEFFYPGGWALDYEFTARGLGIQHYGFWDDRVMTSPDLPPTSYPEGFQGDEIPVDAESVVRIVRMRLNSDEEADDG